MKLTITSLVLGAAATAHGAGFVLNDHGARATGRGDAVIATVSDGSAIVHNVGGIAVEGGTHVYLGASMIFPSASFADDASGMTTDTESPAAVTPQLYFTTRVHEMVTVGAGFHTPFGSRIVWPETSPSADEVRSQTLRSYFITPVVGVDLGKWAPGLTMGAGLDIVPATVELEQDLFFGDERGTVALGGDAVGFGGRVGLMWRPDFQPAFSAGAAYRSPVTLDFEGEGDFDIAAPYRAQVPPDGPISTSLTLPQQVNAGVGYRPVRDFEIEFDAVWMDWSAVDQLDIVLPDGSVTVSERDYEDTVALRFGLEYSPPGTQLDLRTGYMYDPTPVPAERLTAALPDIDRHDLTFGASYHFAKSYNVDLGVLWVIPDSRRTADMAFEPVYKGSYRVTAVVGSLSLGGRWE
jgi:long-chain fatty acid transport protein